MNTWSTVPLLRLLPFFVAGIFSAYQFPLNGMEWPCLAFVIVLSAFWIKRKQQYRNRWIFGLLASLCMLAGGRMFVSVHGEANRPRHFSQFHPGNFIAVLDEQLQAKSKSYKSVLSVVAVFCQGGWQKAEGKLLVYFERDSNVVNLIPGDVISFCTMPQEVAPPANPGQFDYNSWLRYQEIFHSVYLGKDSWKKAGRGEGRVFKSIAGTLRNKLLGVFAQYGITGQEYAVLSALLLGADDDIDPSLYRSYAATGALHILSVSGLHVGIIYLALNAALFFLRHRRMRWVKCVLVLVFLWGYALLTGLSPSVLRASAMLSFVVAGKALLRHSNMFNTLAASAFLLLAIEPGLVMQAGFQLSYLAVAGILWLYPHLEGLFYSRFKIVRLVWSLIAVSLAAQLATFPLCLFYFHQFPNYFLPANMLIIPLSSLILYGGILLFVLNPFPVLASGCAVALSFLLKGLNSLAETIAAFPHAVSDGFIISLAECFLLYILIAGLAVGLIQSQKQMVLVSMATAILLLGSCIGRKIQNENQEQIVVFSFPGRSVIDISDGSNGFTVCSSKDFHEVQAELKSYWWLTGASSHKHIQLNGIASENSFAMKNHWIFFRDKILVHADSTFRLADSVTDTVDILVVGNCRIDPTKMLLKIPCRQVILERAVSKWKRRKWEEAALLKGITCYSIAEKGAYVYKP